MTNSEQQSAILKGKISITRLVCFSAVVMLFMILSVGGIFYSAGSRLLDSTQEKYVQGNLLNAQKMIHTFMDHRLSVLEDFAGSPPIVKGIMEPDVMADNAADFMAGLTLLGSRSQIVLLDRQGRLVHATQPEPLFDYTAEKWLAGLIAMTNTRYKGVSQAGGKHFWRIAVPVLYNGRPEGILLAELDPKEIKKEQPAFDQINTGHLELVYDSVIIASFGPELDSEPQDFPMEAPDLLLRYRWDRQAFETLGNKLFIQAFVALVVLSLLFFMGALLFTRRFLILPLYQLHDQLHTFSAKGGSRHVRTDQRLKEIAVLADDYNKILDTLKDRERALVTIRDSSEELVLERTSALQVELIRHRLMEKKLRLAKDEAESSHQAKNEFLAIMSHELLTPMNGIVGMTRQVQETVLSNEQRRCLKAVRDSANILLGLLHNVLDFAKIEAGQLELEPHPFALADVIDTIQASMTETARQKGILLNSMIDPSLHSMFYGDELRLRQIIMNLVDNAIKFTEEGEVAISIEPETQAPKDGYFSIHFSIADTGIGIPPDKIETIFSSFYLGDSSVSRSHGGIGMGLAVSRRLVEKMGGRIWAESNGEKGSIFHFSLPLSVVKEERGKQIEDRKKSAAPPQKGLRVLLVDDNQINLDLAQMVLESYGHQVVAAINGMMALEMLTRWNFDAVLMDVQMPVLDGLAATEIIRACEQDSPVAENVPAELIAEITARLQGSHLPIIALTGHAMAGDREKCLASGMDEYLTKPFQPEQVAAILTGIIEGKGAITP